MNIKLPFRINDTLRTEIINFVYNSDSCYWIKNNTGNTFNRKFCKISQLDLPISLSINNLNTEVYTALGITNFKYEHIFGNFIGVNAHGGNVHPHTDTKNNDGWFHVRINFLIQKPFYGGMPIINNIEYSINETESWLNLASEWLHSSTIVGGEKERIILSLGAYVDPIHIPQLKKYI